MKITQMTEFPADETTVLTVSCNSPTKAVVMLRRPSWSGEPEVRINGKRVTVKADANGYIPVKKAWKDGDRIQVRYPMSFRLEHLADEPSKAAVFYGPVLLAGRLGTEGFVGCQPDSDSEKHNDYYTYDYNIPEGLDVTLEINEEDLQNSFKKVGPLDFVNEDGDRLSPLYDIHRERYVVYWNL